MTPSPRRQRPAEHDDLQIVRGTAIAAALIAGCSVLLAMLLAWRLLDARERMRVATAECTCCAPGSGQALGAIDGAP